MGQEFRVWGSFKAGSFKVVVLFCLFLYLFYGFRVSGYLSP